MNINTTIILIALLVGGCVNGATVYKPPPPSKWMMSKPCNVKAYPDNEGDPASRGKYYGKNIKCHISKNDQIAGLQGYARTVSKGHKRKKK